MTLNSSSLFNNLFIYRKESKCSRDGGSVYLTSDNLKPFQLTSWTLVNSFCCVVFTFCSPQGSVCSDCVYASFCGPCTWCQISREIKTRQNPVVFVSAAAWSELMVRSLINNPRSWRHGRHRRELAPKESPRLIGLRETFTCFQEHLIEHWVKRSKGWKIGKYLTISHAFTFFSLFIVENTAFFHTFTSVYHFYVMVEQVCMYIWKYKAYSLPFKLKIFNMQSFETVYIS